MKIAVVIGVYDPRGGGAERSTAQIVDELLGRGHSVTIITGYCPDEVLRSDTTIKRYSTSRRRPATWVWGFSRWATGQLARGHYDSSLSVSTLVAADVVQPRGGTVRETLDRNIAMRPKRLSRLTKRALLRLSLKQQILLALERRTLADAMVKRFVPGSRYVAGQLSRHYGIAPERIEMIPNAAVVPQVDDKTRLEWRTRVRSGFNIPDRSVAFLFAAHNPRLKGIDPLLHAMQRVVQDGVDATLLLAGRIGYGHQHRASELGIRKQVRIISTTDRMHELYAAADVTVHPTFYDPSSKVVIESLMMGTPAISTSFNGASDMIRGQNGGPWRGRVVDDPADVPALARAMTELADPAQRRSCVAAMDGLTQSLSMKHHVDRLEEVFAATAANRAAPSEPGSEGLVEGGGRGDGGAAPSGP